MKQNKAKGNYAFDYYNFPRTFNLYKTKVFMEFQVNFKLQYKKP